MSSRIDLILRRAARGLPLFLCAAVLSGSGFAQEAGPTAEQGVVSKPLGEIDLSSQIGDIAGRRLRARLITIAPGGHGAAHSHRGRPTMEYVLQGNVIEIRNGVEVAHGPGEMVMATNEISHWWENRGTVPVVLLPVDVAAAAAAPYEHVVIVIMENHGLAQVVGNPAAPYVTSLARQGMNFTNSHGVTHPSQPNYLALFSGSTQGVTNDSCPHTFSGVNNLSAQLIAAGRSFAGYSESMPSTGFAGCRAGEYVRKHNPWVNFPNVPGSANLPYSAFPSDFAALPTVSFVVPNLISDMHDASINTGDAWLKTHIDAYAQWAKSHNSLLIVTFDEDDSSTSANLIPTILVGAGVAPGTCGLQIDHYTVLATIERIYGLPALTPAPPLVVGALSGQGSACSTAAVAR